MLKLRQIHLKHSLLNTLGRGHSVIIRPGSSVVKECGSLKKSHGVTLMFTVASTFGVAGFGLRYGSGFVQTKSHDELIHTVTSNHEDDARQPLVYNIQAIQKYWFGRPFEVAGRAVEILHVLLPYAFKLIFWECVVRRKIQNHEGLQQKYAIKLREALTALGPSFIKFGQAISIRPDILPSAFLFELQKLCDAVPSFPTYEAIKVIEHEMGQNVSDIFEDFTSDTQPIAAASLGQVYRLKLKHKNAWVAVKVQRPDMLQYVLRDIYIMRNLAFVFQKFKGLVTKQRAFDVALLDTFASASLQELDYLNEAANQEKFSTDLVPKLNGKIYVPAVYHEFTTRKVLVTEWIDGVKLAQSSKETINRLIPVGVECFLLQLLETCYFHADPHPGNLLVTKDGKLAIIDFGLCARVPLPDARTLTLSIVHMMQGDMAGMIDDAIELDFLPKDVDKLRLEKVMQKLYDTARATDDTTRNQHFMAVSYELNKIFFDFPFKVPDYFALLTRAMIVLEGIAVTADPNFDLFASAYPYAFKRAVNLFGLSDLHQIATEALKARFRLRRQ